MLVWKCKKKCPVPKITTVGTGRVKSTTVEINKSIQEITVENQEEKKGRGGARAGAGRKRQDTEARRSTMAISGTPTEIETIRQLAKAAGKNPSRFLIEMALEGK